MGLTDFGAGGDPPTGPIGALPRVAGRPSYTGRHLLVLADALLGDEAACRAVLRDVGVRDVAATSDFAASAIDPGHADAADATLFGELGIAVVRADPDRVGELAAQAGGDPRILAVEPERLLYALTDLPLHPEYLRGYRDAVTHLHERALAAAPAPPAAREAFADTPERTWGLAATGADVSPRTGAGVPVTVLDTGLDLQHPDFVGRGVEARSFVAGEEVQDGQGHGTHCVGTSCGPRSAPGAERRYGVAGEAEIRVGKVLSNAGSGADADILAGLSWAVGGGSRVVSMSLGADVREVSTAYETVGRRALAAGTLIVAAAGNNARRGQGDPGFVGVPANSPSIMAVGAVDPASAVADFSAASNPVAGGQVDVVGPGVEVYSTWPMPQRYQTISGTSMATPHVAGLAALWCERTGAVGQQLWAQLVQAARRLEQAATDVGAGLVQAPRD